MSPAELYEKAQQDATDAQQEAEDWANENNLETWSDGSPRQNYDDMAEDSEPVANDTRQQEAGEEQQQSELDEERAALEADVNAQNEVLNKEYTDLMDKRNAASDSAIESTNVEDRDRFNDLQYDFAEKMEDVRRRIIENNNRLK